MKVKVHLMQTEEDECNYSGDYQCIPERPASRLAALEAEAVYNFELTLKLLPPHTDRVCIPVPWIESILHHVRAPRLNAEQMEAVRDAEALLTDTMSDYGDCEHDVGHCICKYYSGVYALRAAFPEAWQQEKAGQAPVPWLV